MTKCDFCTKSDSKGKCFWDTMVGRESDCKKAINKMIEALGNNRDTKRGKNI